MKKKGYMLLNGGSWAKQVVLKKTSCNQSTTSFFDFWQIGQLATAVQLWSVVIQSSCQSLHQLPTGLQNTNWLWFCYAKEILWTTEQNKVLSSREVLTRRHNVLKDHRMSVMGSGTRGSLDATRHLVLWRISIKKKVHGVAWYKYYGTCHHRM